MSIGGGVPESDRDREQRLAEHDATFPPEPFGYIWHWFSDLTDWRESSMGVGPLSHQEIKAWAGFFCPDIRASEVEVMRQLDRTCRVFHNEKNNPPKPSTGDSFRAVADANAAEKAARASAKKIKPKAKK